MSAKSLNCFEESTIKNKHLPVEWQDQSSLDELAEFLQLNWEQRSVFYDDGKISSRQQYLTLGGQKTLHTNNYIGTIAFKGQQLNIFPKTFREFKGDTDTDELDLKHLMKNLVQWLSYCNRIEYPFINITSNLEDSEDLRELFITLYLHYVKQALENRPFYRYEEKCEDLSLIRGHINFKDYINNKIPNGMGHKFNCSYAEFEFDNIVNRIIKYTCRGLVNSTTSAENKKIIRQVLIRMNEVSDVRCVPSDCDGIRLSKLNRQYTVLLSMSKMFLLNQTSTYQIDNQESFCFLFPTELLFEGFIGGFIKEVLKEQAKVRFQASDMVLIDNLMYDGQSLGKAFTMRHDILVEHKQKGLFILDTKYKEISRFDGNENLHQTVVSEINQSDLYQMFTYANKRGISDVYLLYPLYRFEENEHSYPFGLSNLASGNPIRVHLVRLPFVFEEDIDKTKDMLTAAINKIFD